MANIGGFEGERQPDGGIVWTWVNPFSGFDGVSYAAPGDQETRASRTSPGWGWQRQAAVSTSGFIGLDDVFTIAAIAAPVFAAPLAAAAAEVISGSEILSTGGAMSIFDDIGDVFDTVSDIADTANDLFGGSGSDVIYGDDGGGQMQTVGLGGAVVAGGIWLGSYLGRAFGAGASSAIYTAANGVRVRLAQLWPLIRKYGPQAVAGGLGISMAALGTLAMQAPRTSSRRRRRGISSRDIRTTRRVVGFVNKMQNQIGCVSTHKRWRKGK